MVVALAGRRCDDRDGRDAVLAGDDSPGSAPSLDERRVRAIDRALDHLAGHAAGVDVPSVADVDADVADVALLGLAERQEVAGEKAAGILLDRESLFGLLLCGARHVGGSAPASHTPPVHCSRSLFPASRRPCDSGVPNCALAICTTESRIDCAELLNAAKGFSVCAPTTGHRCAKRGDRAEHEREAHGERVDDVEFDAKAQESMPALDKRWTVKY